MPNVLEDLRSSHVTALFADHELSFALPKGATLEDLAGRLAFLDRGKPLTVTLRLHS